MHNPLYYTAINDVLTEFGAKWVNCLSCYRVNMGQFAVLCPVSGHVLQQRHGELLTPGPPDVIGGLQREIYPRGVWYETVGSTASLVVHRDLECLVLPFFGQCHRK